MAIKDIFLNIKTANKSELLKKAIVLIVVLIAIYYAGKYAFDYMKRDKIFASGTVEAIEVEVATKVPGRVVSFSADEGDAISKGGIIASIESNELEASLAQAKASENSSRIKYDNAERNYRRAISLKRRNMLSDQDFDSTKSQYESSHSDLQRVQASRTLANISLKESTIKAPIAGTILSKVVETGDLLAPYSTVVTMADLSNLEMMIYVSETKYGRIKLGDEVAVNVDSFPGQNFYGKVKSIANKAEFTPKNIQTKEERVSQVFGIKIDIPNPEMKLKPGMPADAVINLSN